MAQVVLGSGPAGTALATELAGRGHEVRLANRSGEGPALPGVDRVAVDVLDRDRLAAVTGGADVVYHCVNVAYHQQVELMPRIQDAILDAAGGRLVVLDTLYPYGPTGGAVMTEETPWAATNRKGRMRAELDANYLEAHRSGRARVSLGRAADFFGPGVFNSSLGATAFPALLAGGEVIGIGDVDRLHSYSFIGDVAAGLATLGEHPDADGRVWHLPVAPAVTTRHIHELLAKITGQEPRVRVLTEARPFGPFDEVFMAEFAELFYQHTEDQVVDSRLFEQTFGVRHTPLETALETTVGWFRAALSRACRSPR
ncbi:nucleoside-diphosphate-sugar epimerase [Amycolatopsis endophytica]|uniref:Nucleoside-diphosphate-sugar epimerase n=1 Tax=Amycolatopsis endophytica TaxID=860233 RepID=A0A853B9R8_9PSEU|nr:NAD-dependent epimerase/dehydratase family protein [Amycolatopsis endophytica]NYI91879.1 nucleoside-diphosphate-sugar epimerase [Amycolatopsis endophytica]